MTEPQNCRKRKAIHAKDIRYAWEQASTTFFTEKYSVENVVLLLYARTLKTKGGVYYKAWNCRERQKGQKGNGCRCRLISEESLIAEIVKALGWETMDEGRFGREVSRVLVSDDDVQVEC